MKKRERYKWVVARKDEKGNLLCLIPNCNNLRQKHKTRDTTRNYCKDHMCSDMWEFTSWKTIRENALKRDNYTCVKCNDNRREIVVTIRSEWFSEIREKEITINNLIGDHIIPIALGGDEFDIDNVQTLCLKCNKIKTKQDSKDIAIQRRKEKSDNYKNMKIIK